MPARRFREIIAKEQPLSEIFSDLYAFRVPRYQRPYAWEAEHAEQLLDDLLDATGDDAGAEVSGLAPYFLGSVVLVRPDLNRTETDVVDGQQRLTTLSLLIACLRDRLPPEFASNLDERLRQRCDPLLERPEVPRLRLRDRDQVFYADHILASNGLQQKLDVTKLSDSQRNLWKNAQLIRERLAGLGEARAERLAKFTLTRCYLVVVTTLDRRSAYRIFSVLNDRGMDLQATDILKSEIIARLPEIDRETYARRWEDVEEELGRDGFLDLIAHIRMIRRKAKLRKSVLDEVQEHVLPSVEPRDFVDELLVPLGQAMTVLLDAGHESAQHAEEINSVIRCLHFVDNSDWIPPALAFYRRERANAAVVLRFLRDLERLAASLMVRRVNITNRIVRYGSVLLAIEAEQDLYADSSPLQLTDDEKNETLAALAGDIYLVTRIRRSVVLRLDQFLGDGMATYNHSYITVEHVLPQNPATGSTWLSSFPHEEERLALVHKLGNLALLSRRKNSSANNRPFSEKKQSYFTKGGVSTFALTTDVVGESEWTPEVIRARQERLLGVLKEGWRL